MKGEFERRPEVSAFQSIGIDELNFAEFPLAAIADDVSQQRTLTFVDSVMDESQQARVERKLIISASDLFGLPTSRDNDVLLVLIHATKLANQFQERTVAFQRGELVRRLGWDDSGKSYQRLDESLQRWTGVTLHYNGSWWDKSVKRWRSKTFHVLESLELKGRSLAKSRERDDGRSTFTWNEVVFASFQAKNLKSLNLDTYFRLKRPASRQAYRFLDKRFWHSSRLVFDFKTFCCEHVGYSRNYNLGQLKRKSAPMFRELEQVGFLKAATDEERFTSQGKGKCQVTVTKNATSDSDDNQHLPEIVRQLMERGIKLRMAKTLVSEHSAERIREKLRLFDYLTARQDRRMARSPAGFLVKAIHDDYRPEDFVAAEKQQLAKRRQCQRRSTSVEVHQSDAPTDQEDRKRWLRIWQQMPEPEREHINAQALQSASHFHKATYDRLRSVGGPLWASIREDLVLRFLQANAAETASAANPDEA